VLPISSVAEWTVAARGETWGTSDAIFARIYYFKQDRNDEEKGIKKEEERAKEK
jgi:hypothetical protein